MKSSEVSGPGTEVRPLISDLCPPNTFQFKNKMHDQLSPFPFQPINQKTHNDGIEGPYYFLFHFSYFK